jgi:hypothetical protein
VLPVSAYRAGYLLADVGEPLAYGGTLGKLLEQLAHLLLRSDFTKLFRLFHRRECIVKVNLRRSDEDSLDEVGILCLNLWFKAVRCLQ